VKVKKVIKLYCWWRYGIDTLEEEVPGRISVQEASNFCYALGDNQMSSYHLVLVLIWSLELLFILV